MIYLDNAATTLIKPQRVYQAVMAAMHTAAGAGRSGHRPAVRAGRIVYECREAIAQLFQLEDSTQVVFTANATHALNIAINALCIPEKKVAISGYEHNSVVRPLTKRGIDFTVLESALFDQAEMVHAAEQAIEQGVSLFVINHVSNVFGSIAPLEALDALFTARGVSMILDASQSAGILDINTKRLTSLAAVCMPGHKALYGPQGTGVLLVLSDALNDTLMQGGTGSLSSDIRQPEFLPDRFESGTLNAHGIAGLCEGVRFIERVGLDKIYRHEQTLMRALAKGMRTVHGAQVFSAPDEQKQCGVLSFRHPAIAAEEIAEALAKRDICVRAGLHCAPLAHRSAGTLASGTVRVSVSFWNNLDEITRFVSCCREIVENSGAIKVKTM